MGGGSMKRLLAPNGLYDLGRKMAGLRGLVLAVLAVLMLGCESEHRSVIVYESDIPVAITPAPCPGLEARRLVEVYFWVTGPDGMPMGDVWVTWEDRLHSGHGFVGVTFGYAYHDPTFRTDMPVNLYPPVVLDAPAGTELMFRFQKDGYLDAWLVYPVPPAMCHTDGPAVVHAVVVMEPW